MTKSGAPQPCATCPFLRDNHGKKHPAGWYKAANLKRLWNGLRSGRAPGMICHSTDPEAIEYGGPKKIAPGHIRDCIGANTLVQREFNILATPGLVFKEYRRQRPFGMTKIGIANWITRAYYGGTILCSAPKPLTGDVDDDRIALPAFISRSKDDHLKGGG